MFGSASPTLSEDDVFELAIRVLGASDSQPSKRWCRLAPEPQPCNELDTPWQQGYDLAIEWAESSGLTVNTSGYVDIEGHLGKLGVSTDEMALSDRGTSGLAVLPAGGRPHIVVNTQHPKCQFPTGRRFVMAHELCHLLHDSEVGRDLALISGVWAPRELEQRANAFAAALLMPRGLVRDGLAALTGRLDREAVIGLAHAFHVSTTALVHHLQNLRLIDEGERDTLLDELATSRAAAEPL
jgi:hypothetical protein